MSAIRTAILIVLMTISACQRKPVESVVEGERLPLTDAQLARLATRQILFGHQSVGDDIVDGLRDVMAADPRLKLHLVRSREPKAVPGPAFVDFPIGKNGDPHSKDLDFAALVGQSPPTPDTIALFKYCYVDVDSSTDVARLFGDYRHTIEELQAKHPALKVVPVTMPLTTDVSSARVWVKSVLGRTTPRDLNVKRNRFNELVRSAYSAGPLFDLAAVESTHADGSRSFFTRNHETVYTLAAEFTTDGGHLNQSGRRAAAEQLLLVLSRL